MKHKKVHEKSSYVLTAINLSIQRRVRLNTNNHTVLLTYRISVEFPKRIMKTKGTLINTFVKIMGKSSNDTKCQTGIKKKMGSAMTASTNV